MQLKDLPAVFALGQRVFTAQQLPTLYRSWDEDEVVQLYLSWNLDDHPESLERKEAQRNGKAG